MRINSRNCKLVAKKEFKGLINEKTIVLALLLQLFIAMFSSFLLVGLASMYNPDAMSKYSKMKYPIAYAGETSHLYVKLMEDPNLIVYPMELSPAVSALSERQLAAVVWVPRNMEETMNPMKVTIYLIENDIQSGIVSAKLKSVLTDYETELRDARSDRLTAMPVEMRMPATNPAGDFYEFVYGVLIPLLVFMPAIISGALIIDMITEESQNKTLETLMSTPVSFTDMVWGKILAAFLLVPLQAGTWMILLILNGIYIGGFIEILMHISIVAFILILIAATFAMRYRERTNAQFMFSIATVVVLVFALSIPMNSGNIIVRLATGSIGAEHMIVLLPMLAVAMGLSYFVTKYSERLAQKL